jgi:uncharacterized protein (DUF433 family)
MASETSSKTGYAHVAHTPGVVGGEARVADHRIRVRDVVAARDLGGLSPEIIASTVYPDLTLAQVYAALAYYEDHRDEIDRHAHADTQYARQFLRDHPELVHDARPEKSHQAE